MEQSLFKILCRAQKLEFIHYNNYNYKTKNLNVDLITNSHSELTTNQTCGVWLKCLTKVVMRIILTYLEHEDLINLTVAYPDFIHDILSSTYWKRIDVYLDGNVLTRDEFKLMINHLGDTIELLCFDGQLCIGHEELINNLTNLKKLELFNVHSECIINRVCNNMVLLSDIKMEYLSLNDSHIDLIRLSLKKLQSFSFCTDCTVNRGIQDLLKSMTSVRKFGLRAKDISEELIETLINHHHKTLIEIYISSQKCQPKDTSLASIYKCNQLKRLLLSNVELTQPYYNIICSLNHLEDMMISFHCITGDKLEYIDECFFSEPKLNLKRLYIGGLMVFENFLDSMTNNFPNLTTLVFHSIWVWKPFEIKAVRELFLKLEIIHLIRFDYKAVVQFLEPLNDEEFLRKDLKLKELVIDIEVVDDKTDKVNFLQKIDELKKIDSFKFHFKTSIDLHTHNFTWPSSDEDFKNNIFEIYPL